MRNVCDAVVEVLRSRSAEVPLNLEEILSHVIVLGALDRTQPHDTAEISDALAAEMRRRAETHLPQRFTTSDGVWWELVDPPPPLLRPAGRSWMAQLLRDMRWRSTSSIGTRLESFRYDGSSATALLRASRQHDEHNVTLAGQVAGVLVVPRLRGGLTVAADVDGDIIIDGPIAGDVTISGQVAGSILVRGAIDGTVHVASTVQRSVRINAKHVGRLVIDGQLGGSLHVEARVIDGLAVSGWVADDLTVAGTVAGGVRVAADISGRIGITKRVMGNVKLAGWILGGIDVSGRVEGELAISAWVGGPVSITAPVVAVNLGSGRFHGAIKIRPEQTGGARTTLTSVRLAEFHAPVRVHCDVDTAAVDSAGVVGRSQLRCVGSKRRPSGQEVRRPHTPTQSRSLPRAPRPVRLQTNEREARPPSTRTPSVPSVPATEAHSQPTESAAELLPNPRRPVQSEGRLPAADSRLTLAELAQACEPAVESSQPLVDVTPTRPTQSDIERLRTLADIAPTPPTQRSIDTPPPRGVDASVGRSDLPVVQLPPTSAHATPTQSTAPAVLAPPTCTQVIPTQSATPAAPSTPMVTQPVPTQLQLLEPPSATLPASTQQIPIQAVAAENDLGATKQLVLGIAWLS